MLIVLSQEKPMGQNVGWGRLAKRQGVGVLWRGSSSLRHVQKKHFVSHACTRNSSLMHVKNLFLSLSLMYIQKLVFHAYLRLSYLPFFLMSIFLFFSILFLYGENQQEKGAVVLKICYFCLYL